MKSGPRARQNMSPLHCCPYWLDSATWRRRKAGLSWRPTLEGIGRLIAKIGLQLLEAILVSPQPMDLETKGGGSGHRGQEGNAAVIERPLRSDTVEAQRAGSVTRSHHLSAESPRHPATPPVADRDVNTGSLLTPSGGLGCTTASWKRHGPAIAMLRSRSASREGPDPPTPQPCPTHAPTSLSLLFSMPAT
jgi:hypothetical protein